MQNIYAKFVILSFPLFTKPEPKSTHKNYIYIQIFRFYFVGAESFLIWDFGLVKTKI